MKTCVLDANALLTYLQDRPGSSRVGQLMKEAASRERSLLMSVVNWGEVFYSTWQISGEEVARSVISSPQIPIEIVPVDLVGVMAAAEMKVRHKLPYADCFAAALAMSHRATLVTADPHFKKLGQRVPIMWLSRQ